MSVCIKRPEEYGVVHCGFKDYSRLTAYLTTRHPGAIDWGAQLEAFDVRLIAGNRKE
jgi:hypothetical protein